MVDDLGYADLSSYGSTDMQTPQLDRLMAEGMRFNEFYTNSCVCSPTRAAFLTGRYPEMVGMPGVTRLHKRASWGNLTPDSVMLPELFQAAGYKTTLIGKWHLGIEDGDRPNQRGFDEFQGLLLGMMDDYWEHSRQGFQQMRRNEEKIHPEGHGTDLITQWSIEAIERDVKAGIPFFQFLAYNAPHFPVQPPEEWLEKVQEREPGIDPVRAKMVAFVEHLDDGIGKVLAAVDDLGIRENTIVYFSSDNGGLVRVGSNNGSLRAGKTDVYEGGIKSPAVIRWPARIAAEQQTNFRALTMDVIPTIAEVCGISIDHPIDGQSFAELLLTGKQNPFARPEFYMWMQNDRTEKKKENRKDCSKEAVRFGDWKLVQNAWMPLHNRSEIKYELFNLAKDPSEENNVAKKYPEKTKQLTQLLETHIKKARKVQWK